MTKSTINPNISRRDFLNGVSLFTAASLTPRISLAQIGQSNTHPSYPPSLMGMRGNHNGSFETIHQLVMTGKSTWGKLTELDEHYDLVVVGAGISGLSAAHFYLKQKPNAKVLILDNHDDFGGHAKRNEFQVGNKTIIGYGGSQTLQEPNFYGDAAKQFIRDIGIDLDKLAAAYDTKFFHRHGLRGGTQFQKKHWGENSLIHHDMGYFDGFMPMVRPSISFDELISQFPISDSAKVDLRRLFNIEEDKLAHLTYDEKWEYLAQASYRDFVSDIIGIDDQQVFDILDFGTIDFSRSLEAISAVAAMGYGGLPGWGATGLPDEEISSDYLEPYLHHFPDGNASVARLAVRQMIPSVASGNTMEDVVTSSFDYSKLDIDENNVRLRLNSPVVNVVHMGQVNAAQKVKVTYVKDENTYEITANHVIMACNNRVIPKLCPEIPEAQKSALSELYKTPIIYTTVLLKNWHAWKKLGIGGVISPKSFYINTTLDFPVSIGDYKFSSNPDEPIIVHMERFPYPSIKNISDIEQLKQSRRELLGMSFATIENNTREQLQDLLSEGGFNHQRDILGITVNRWSHGYSTRSLFEPYYESLDHPEYPHVKGRETVGRIAIANSDAAGRALLDQSVRAAYLAVNELI